MEIDQKPIFSFGHRQLLPPDAPLTSSEEKPSKETVSLGRPIFASRSVPLNRFSLVQVPSPGQGDSEDHPPHPTESTISVQNALLFRPYVPPTLEEISANQLESGGSGKSAVLTQAADGMGLKREADEAEDSIEAKIDRYVNRDCISLSLILIFLLWARICWQDPRLWLRTNYGSIKRSQVAKKFGVPSAFVSFVCQVSAHHVDKPSTRQVTKRIRLLEEMFPVPHEPMSISPLLGSTISLPPSPAPSSTDSDLGPIPLGRKPKKKRKKDIAVSDLDGVFVLSKLVAPIDVERVPRPSDHYPPIAADDVFGPGILIPQPSETTEPSLIAEAKVALSQARNEVLAGVDLDIPETYSLPLPSTDEEAALVNEIDAFTEWADRQREMVRSIEQQRASWEDDFRASKSRRPPTPLLEMASIEVKDEKPGEPPLSLSGLACPSSDVGLSQRRLVPSGV